MLYNLSILRKISFKGEVYMDYGYEKILIVQRKCGVSFEDADKALKWAKGDEDKACRYAIRKKGRDRGWLKKTLDALNNFLTYRIKISKDGDVKFNIPLGIIIIICFFAMIIFSGGRYYNRNGIGILGLIVFAIIVLTGYSIEISQAEKKQEHKLEKIVSDEMPEDEVFEQFQEDEVEAQEDGYNTIEIE
jgi:hypothetical protein